MITSYSVYCWIKTTERSQNYPAIATNKKWESGALFDYTGKHNYGCSLTSGSLYGWAFVLQPNGAWAWNIGDGEQRLDYQPTCERQRISDGRWHLLAFSVDGEDLSARLYFDGVQVALYSLAAIKFADQSPGSFGLLFDQDEVLHEIPIVLNHVQVLKVFKKRFSHVPFVYPKFEVKRKLRIMSWNIWNGGREDGNDVGVQRVTEIIQKTDADVIAMQETYVSGPRIADALGYHFYLRSSNLSIISRFPALSHHSYFLPFNLGGVSLQLSSALSIDVFTLWLHYLPDFCSDVLLDDITKEALEAAEWDTRAYEMKQILGEISKKFSGRRLFLAGDFNCPSHLDWTESARHLHRNLTVQWPVSKQIVNEGFSDSYRDIYPDEKKYPGHTWTPRNSKSWQDRIDYIYFRGSGVRCVDVKIYNTHEVLWPSDHAAVCATYDIDE